jgi:hypothetical protein
MRALPSTSRVRQRARISETENREESDSGDANRDPGADTEVVATRSRFGNLGGEDDESNDDENDTDEQRNNDETDTDELNRNPTGAIGIRSPRAWTAARVAAEPEKAQRSLDNFRASLKRVHKNMSKLSHKWPRAALVCLTRKPPAETCVFFHGATRGRTILD